MGTSKPSNPPLIQTCDPNGVFSAVTLRDFFAAAAMVGELASQSVDQGIYGNDATSAKALARGCYCFADAMLAAREEQ